MKNAALFILFLFASAARAGAYYTKTYALSSDFQSHFLTEKHKRVHYKISLSDCAGSVEGYFSHEAALAPDKAAPILGGSNRCFLILPGHFLGREAYFFFKSSINRGALKVEIFKDAQ